MVPSGSPSHERSDLIDERATVPEMVRMVGGVKHRSCKRVGVILDEGNFLQTNAGLTSHVDPVTGLR